MRKLLFALPAVALAVTTAAAAADPPVTGTTCTKYKNGVCVQSHKVRGHPYKVGYVFGPNYTYTAVTALPQPVVTQFSLTPDYRYVYADGYVYVVNPSTYAVTRVIEVPGP